MLQPADTPDRRPSGTLWTPRNPVNGFVASGARMQRIY